MSEQNLQRDPSNSDNVAADDPLAELARIVSGEENFMKPAPEKTVQPALEVEVAAPVAPTAPVEAMDLESQLLAELGIVEATPAPIPVAAVEPDLVVESEVEPDAANVEMLGFDESGIDGLEFESAFEEQLGDNHNEETAQAVSPSAVEPEVEAAVAELENAFAVTPVETPIEPIVEQTSFVEDTPPVEANVETSVEPIFDATFDASFDASGETELEDAFADAFQNEMSIEEAPSVGDLPVDNFEASFEQQISEAADVLTHREESAVSIDNGAIDTMMPEASLAIEPELEVPEAQVIAPPVPPMSKSSGGFKMAATALGMALVIGGGAIGYGYFKEGGYSGPPVLVRADKGDFKEKPKNAGGKKIANQNQPVYDNLAGKKSDAPKQNKLVKTSEKPVEITANIAKPRVEKSAERLATGNNGPRADNSATAVIKPRKVKTVTVRADGTIVTSSGEKIAALPVVKPVVVAPVVPTTPAVPIAKPVAVAPVVEATRSIAAPKPADIPLAKTFPVENTQVTALAPIAKPVTVAPAIVEATPVKISPAAPVQSAVPPGSYVVQISSQRSRSAAEASYQNLKRRFAGLLGSKGKEIKSASIKDKGTFFRVRIPIGSKSAATKFCSRYKSQGGSCFITK